jgi:cytochrome c5
MKSRTLTLAMVVLSACCLKSVASPQNPASPLKANAGARSTAQQAAKEGERRFRANCGRCHNPPESISPREVKAVLQHMRVRAMLSAEDEQLILKYLAP